MSEAYEGQIPDANTMKRLADTHELTMESVHTWMRNRHSLSKFYLRADRFAEAAWRLLIYLSTFSLGVYCIYPQGPEDLPLMWSKLKEDPFSMDFNLKAYYLLLVLPLYVNLLFSHILNDRKRADFWEMLCHHILVLILGTLSYMGNFVELGTVIVLLHDITDIFLESAKLLNYLKRQHLADFCFFCFTW